MKSITHFNDYKMSRLLTPFNKDKLIPQRLFKPFSWLYLLTLSMLATTAIACQTIIEIPQLECQVLVKLYHQTGGHDWYNNTGWHVDDTPCSWYGISCTRGHVTGIYLSSNQLKGSIPQELGYLIHLKFLSLDSNQLTGPIPKTLARLRQLEKLYLQSNQLTGEIPQAFAQLSRLQELDLFNNQLTGPIPQALTQLRRLRKLYLGFNQLSGPIPVALGQLTQLVDLDLFNNQLTGSIPPQLGQLSQLQKLYLSFNQLTGSIPKELGHLKQLKRLSLSSNQLTGSIPKELGNLTQLQNFSVDNNQLTGSIPASLSRLSRLMVEGTNLGYNALTASDPKLIDFLENRARGGKDPDWAQTQTIPPVIVNAQALSATAVKLEWQKIPYTKGKGYYQVKYAVQPGGPYIEANTPTVDKHTTTYTVTGLSPNTTYYFVIETHTAQHDQYKTLTHLKSVNSGEVKLNTLPFSSNLSVTALKTHDS